MGTGKIEKYSIHATKCIEQSLEETWFLWLSDNKEVEEVLSSAITLTEATDLLFHMCRGGLKIVEEEYATARKQIELFPPSGLFIDLLRKSLDYTDWRRLAKRLCETFNIHVKDK